METKIRIFILCLVNIYFLLKSPTSSSSCISSYDGISYAEEDDKCRDCSDPGKFYCHVESYPEWNKLHREWVEQATSEGDYEAKIAGVEVHNETLKITFEVPSFTQAVLMTFSTVADIVYRDDFYAQNKRYRVFDLRKNTEDALSRQKYVSYSCVRGLDTCTDHKKSDLRLYVITLITVPKVTTTVNYISVNTSVLRTAISISNLTGTKAKGVRVVVSPYPDVYFDLYIVENYILKKEGQWELVTVHSIFQRDSEKDCEFSGLIDGIYKIRISLERIGEGKHIHAFESSKFSFEDGIITMAAKNDVPPIPPKESPLLYAVIGALLGVALLVVLACFAWTKRNRGRRSNHLSSLPAREEVRLVSSAAEDETNEVHRIPDISSSTHQMRLFVNRDEAKSISEVEIHCQSKSINHFQQEYTLSHLQNTEENEGTGREGMKCGRAFVKTSLDDSVPILSSDRNLEECMLEINFDGNTNGEDNSASTSESHAERLPLNLSCYCPQCTFPYSLRSHERRCIVHSRNNS